MLDRFEPFGSRNWYRQAVMPVDAYRRGDEFHFVIDLPGVDPQSVEVTVDRNVLTVTASRTWQREDGDKVFAVERLHGTSTRRFQLGHHVDAEGIRASYDHGVLTLVVPVAEAAKARRIPISTGASVSPGDAEGAEGVAGVAPETTEAEAA
jgi:HSP20 family protein